MRKSYFFASNFVNSFFSEQKESKPLNDVTSLIFKFGNNVGARNANGNDPYLTIEGNGGIGWFDLFAERNPWH